MMKITTRVEAVAVLRRAARKTSLTRLGEEIGECREDGPKPYGHGVLSRWIDRERMPGLVARAAIRKWSRGRIPERVWTA